MSDFLSKIFDFVKSVFDVEGVSAILGVPVKYIYIGAALIVICAIIAIGKKALKVGAALFVLGFLIVAVGPLAKSFFAQNGVFFENGKLSIATSSGQQEIIDFEKAMAFETKEEGENTIIVVHMKDESTQSYTVPTKVAGWAVKIMKVAGKIVEAGENTANQFDTDNLIPSETSDPTETTEPILEPALAG